MTTRARLDQEIQTLRDRGHVTTHDAIRELRRESKRRYRQYPSWISEGTLTVQEGARRLVAVEVALMHLNAMCARGGSSNA